jgi:hypothetical protein
VLAGMLSKLSVDPSSGDFINPLAPCMPIFLDPTTRSQLLREMPMLDDIDITAWQTGDQSCGVHIPRTDITGCRRSAETTSSFDKGKEKIVPSRPASKVGSWSPPSDGDASSEEIAPL